MGEIQTLSVDDQMKISRVYDYAKKRNPNPDHKESCQDDRNLSLRTQEQMLRR